MVINFDSSSCNFPKLLFSKACKTANVFVNFKSFKIVVAKAEFHARIYGQEYPNFTMCRAVGQGRAKADYMYMVIKLDRSVCVSVAHM